MKQHINLSHVETVHNFYSSLLDEVQQAGYNSQEISLLGDTHSYYGRYLDPDLRNYFVQTVVPQIACALSYFSFDQPNQKVFDLGCGLGMQSIIFASLGAKVVAVDMREEAILLCQKRKTYYEKTLNIDLDIDFIHCDFCQSVREDFNLTFDCLFSMAAFSYIEPLDRTVKLISSILKDDAQIFLYERNSTHPLDSFRGRRMPSPSVVIESFQREEFTKEILYGGCSLPGLFWKFPLLNRSFLNPINNLLRQSLYLSINYVLGMKRGMVKY